MTLNRDRDIIKPATTPTETARSPQHGDAGREHELRAFAAALPFLPPAWRQPGSLPDTETLWGYLQEWMRQAESQMDELEGYLLSARREPAFRALDPEGTLADVGRVRGWLRDLQEREDWSAFLRYIRARPVLLSTYERLVRIRAFFRGPERSRLVLVYSYLTASDLTLPAGEPFRELRELHATLMDMLSAEEVLLEPPSRQRLWDGFAAFLFRYKKTYAREHERRLRPEVLAPYRRLRERPEYGLLRRLGQLQGAPVKAALEDLEGRLGQILAIQCPGVDEALLEARPTCTCGFRLDTPPPEPLAALEEDLQREVRQGLRLFGDPEVKRRLAAHRDWLVRQGKELEAEGLNQLLAELVSPGEDADLVRVSQLLDGAIIQVVNDALTTSAPVLPRSLDSLVEQLAGREWSWEHLQEAVALWAFGSTNPPLGSVVLPVLSGETKGMHAPRVRRQEHPHNAKTSKRRYPDTFADWERCYEQLHAGPSPESGGQARPPSGQSGELNRAFQQFYRRHLSDEDGGASANLVALTLFEPRLEGGLFDGIQKPVTLPLLLRRAEEWVRGRNSSRRALLWVDALRYDVWLQVLQELGNRVRIIDGGFLWAWPPATTTGQMARLDAQGIRFSLLEVDDKLAASAGVRLASSDRGPLPISYLNVLEEAISQEEPPGIPELAARLSQRLQALLSARPGYEWLVFGDHGFLEHSRLPTAPVSSPSFPGGLYRQGGETMEEVLVPWTHLQATHG